MITSGGSSGKPDFPAESRSLRSRIQVILKARPMAERIRVLRLESAEIPAQNPGLTGFRQSLKALIHCPIQLPIFRCMQDHVHGLSLL